MFYVRSPAEATIDHLNLPCGDSDSSADSQSDTEHESPSENSSPLKLARPKYRSVASTATASATHLTSMADIGKGDMIKRRRRKRGKVTAAASSVATDDSLTLAVLHKRVRLAGKEGKSGDTLETQSKKPIKKLTRHVKIASRKKTERKIRTRDSREFTQSWDGQGTSLFFLSGLNLREGSASLEKKECGIRMSVSYDQYSSLFKQTGAKVFKEFSSKPRNAPDDRLRKKVSSVCLFFLLALTLFYNTQSCNSCTCT